jgi:hypothetical protein
MGTRLQKKQASGFRLQAQQKKQKQQRQRQAEKGNILLWRLQTAHPPYMKAPPILH